MKVAYCLLIMLCIANLARSSCSNKDVFEDLMRVMVKMKCTPGKTQHEVPKQKTAFFVRLKKHLKLTTNEVVKFDSVQTNDGNGYDITTGIFTVPAAGVYEITVNLILVWV